MNKTKTLIHLCKCYEINKKEYSVFKEKIYSQENTIYFYKINKMAESIKYVDNELIKIRKICGEQAYLYFIYRYIKKLSIEATVKKLSTSQSSLYREIKKWNDIYEQN